MSPLEIAARIAGAFAIPLWMGAGGAPLSEICFYILVAVPLFSLGTAMSRSGHKLSLRSGLWYVPELYAWFVVLGFTGYGAGLLVRSTPVLHALKTLL